MSRATNVSKTLAIILGGGRGNRLYPLTKTRAKPAVPLAGSYRLIDVPVSNCINSKLNKIFILTQFNSASLNRHIFQSYKFDIFRGGFVEMLAAEQTATNANWFQGTADAVRQNLWHFTSFDFDHYIILAGDHLYRMDYSAFINNHVKKNADISIGVYPVDERKVKEFGIMKVDNKLNITSFAEKPTDKEIVNQFRTSPEVLQSEIFEKTAKKATKKTPRKKGKTIDKSKSFLASMGIYVFKKEVLHKLMEDERLSDFGSQVIPQSLDVYKVIAHPFHGYWEDIGTIESFFKANLALTDTIPPFEFHSNEGLIYTHPRFLPGTHVEECKVKRTLVANGCCLMGAEIEHSVIGVRSTVNPKSKLKNVVMMGADENEINEEKKAKKKRGVPKIGIGSGCNIENAIIDKNARIGNNVVIKNLQKHDNFDGKGYAIREGIVVIEKNAIIPNNTKI